jgi:hypothetical protein
MSGIATGWRERRLITIMDDAEKKTNSQTRTTDATRQDGINLADSITVGRSVRFDRVAIDCWIERHRERVPRSFGTMEDP